MPPTTADTGAATSPGTLSPHSPRCLGSARCAACMRGCHCLLCLRLVSGLKVGCYPPVGVPSEEVCCSQIVQGGLKEGDVAGGPLEVSIQVRFICSRV